jgi:hypothetical protein
MYLQVASRWGLHRIGPKAKSYILSVLNLAHVNVVGLEKAGKGHIPGISDLLQEMSVLLDTGSAEGVVLSTDSDNLQQRNKIQICRVKIRKIEIRLRSTHGAQHKCIMLQIKIQRPATKAHTNQSAAQKNCCSLLVETTYMDKLRFHVLTSLS